MFSPEETESSDGSLGNVSEMIPSFGSATLELDILWRLGRYSHGTKLAVLKTSIFNVDLLPQQWEPYIVLRFSRKMDTSGFIEFLCRQSK